MKLPSALKYVFCLLVFVQQCFPLGYDPTTGYLILAVAGILLAEKRKEDGIKEGQERGEKIGRLEAKRQICVWLYDPKLVDDTGGEAKALEYREECLRCVERKTKEECEEIEICEFRDDCCFRRFVNVIIDTN